MSDLEEGELIDSDGEDELRAGAQAGARTEPAGVVPPVSPRTRARIRFYLVSGLRY